MIFLAYIDSRTSPAISKRPNPVFSGVLTINGRKQWAAEGQWAPKAGMVMGSGWFYCVKQALESAVLCLFLACFESISGLLTLTPGAYPKMGNSGLK